MAVTQYTATEGIRWDNIAYLAFGDVSRIKEIMDLNPDIPKDLPIEAGTKIYIPIYKVDTVPNPELLPPWKR